ncbi:filamentous haemagglutinin family protein [Rhodoplanes sp. TEM]|uniref:filamentous haemagglutinin family protein n=1 Tax=Rhodoplanes sp. TEM TaxID=3025489 RepID=UPI002350EC01|nr:filamentous haemagglutinin family protein [Rhodoplanes sp. TEM]
MLFGSVSALALALATTLPAHAGSLRGMRSGASASAVATATAAATSAAQAAAAAQASSISNLTSSLKSMRAVQNAAQAAAKASAAAATSSFNGLGAGALQPVGNPNSTTDGLTTWTGADLPTQTVSDGKYSVTIEQTQSRAILSWESFNIGSATTLTFDQQGNTDWVALNRVVGASTSPSQILGTIKADGTVLVINQNGIIFGAGSQINVHSLIASTLEIGRSTENSVARTIAQRNTEFLDYGLTGYAETNASTGSTYAAFSGVTDSATAPSSAAVTVEEGAIVTSDSGGMILLIAPTVTNAGWLSAADGQVSLVGAKALTGSVYLTASDGSDTAEDPYVRGYLITNYEGTVVNSGLIEAERGYIDLAATTVTNSGILRSTTSVSANGTIDLHGQTITLAPGSILMIAADENGETIPQDADSLAAVKSSQVRIGSYNSDVTLQSGATIWAPSGDVTIGAASGAALTDASQSKIYDTATGKWVYNAGHIVVEDGATIDVAGLKDVQVDVSAYNLSILLKSNELADSGGYQDSFLNGETVMIDARLSGVREDGVAWIGSPLISAAAYYEAVGVTAAQLMTTGGNVTLGTNGGVSSATVGGSASVTVKSGAVIDVSGGFVTYAAGTVTTTKLLTSDGRIVDIGSASLSDTYVAVVPDGTSVGHEHWGVTEVYTNKLRSSSYHQTSYTEGRDAGTLTIKSAQVSYEGTLTADAYAGERQLAEGEVGTGTSSVYGDLRNVQEATSQLPAGGLLFIQQVGDPDGSGTVMGGGGDILVVAAADYAPVAGTTVLSDALLSGSGLAQVSLWTSGTITVAETAGVSLEAGGVFDAYAGRAITIAGSVTVPSGTIQLETANFGLSGSAFTTADDILAVGSFDIVVTGSLSVAGRWVNDWGKTGTDIAGPAYLDGGSIVMVSAAAVTDQVVSTNTNTIASATDVSGSILIANATLIDLSGGGRVTYDGTLDLSGQGGDLALINQTAFFQTEFANYGLGETRTLFGELSGFRTYYLDSQGVVVALQINPAEITSTVQFDPAVIKAAGFSGGGTFTLWAPDVKFGSGASDDTAAATAVPLSFFQAGFADYVITSYKTALLDNTFVTASGTGYGGTNAILETQTFTIKAGETLTLSQALLPSILTEDQAAALRALATGGDVGTILTASVPTEAWDQKAVNLTLDGAIELKVEAGGSIVSAPGAVLTVAKLLNEGTIRLPGGSIVQSQTLPASYLSATKVYGVDALSEVFTIEADGTIVATKASKISGKTNADVAMLYEVYLLGELGAADGIVLAAGSVTDLSGVSVVDPYAAGARGTVTAGVRTGTVYDAGSIVLASASTTTTALYRETRLSTLLLETTAGNSGATLTIGAGATVALDGASDIYVQALTSTSASGAGLRAGGLVITEVWSDAGAISAPSGFTISSEAEISAKGGSASAEGGTLELADVILTQSVADAKGELAADQIMAAGFGTLAALGTLSSQGDVTLTLGRALFVASRPYGSATTTAGNPYAVTISAGGDLSITAPYIGLLSSMDVLSSTATGTAASHTVTLTATAAFDIAGAVLFDRSIAATNLVSGGDVRLTGVQDYKITYQNSTVVNDALTALLAVNGDLAITAAQVYPTTGTTATISTTKTDGIITFARSTATLPDAPYSAGGSLTVSAATIVQGGVIRVPLGSLTLAATGDLTLTDGSYTEVSANGLIIPYGTTTDGVEWYFTPIGSDALSAPPEKVLTLKGANIEVESGAVVNVAGGGDVTAYEFAAGTGGARDVLNSYNDDAYTSTTGCTYAGCAQAYAIVPGLSDNAVAAYDPIYSSNYASLSSVTGVGTRVLIDIGYGLKWYTLLPAQYATLAGGVLVVQQTASTSLTLGSSVTRADGTVLTVGSYGNALSGSAQSSTYLFAVQSQDVYEKYSSITLTSGNTYFTDLADDAGTTVPALPIDAGRLVLDATTTLVIDAIVRSAAAEGGRGAKVDIGGSTIAIVSALPATPAADTLTITAASLTNLGAESLLIGATRTDEDDGTTTLAVTAGSITVANDAAHPISAAEIVLAATGSITIADGSVILATGEMADTRDGVYVIGDGATAGTGALLRVANGPERLTSRSNFESTATLTVGAATLSGTAVMVDSSGTVTLSDALVLQNAETVALGAGRIGLGISDPGYAGVVLTAAMQALLTQTGAQLTLRSQSAIDFADGTYAFGTLKLDAATLAGTQGGAVTVTAGTVTLGNSGAEGAVCGSCAANAGSLAIVADTVVFSGGIIATKATTTASTVTTTLATDTAVTIPAGTYFSSTYYVLEDTKVLLPAGTVVTLDVGTGVITPVASSGTLASGTEVTVSGVAFTMATGSYVLAEATRVYYSSDQPNSTVAAGTVLSFTRTPTVTIPTGATLDLAADVALTGTDFFAGGVTLTAANGVYVTGQGAGLDAGAAALTVHTPYVGDRGSRAATVVVPDLTLATTGALVIDNAGAAALDIASLGGIPGTSVALTGGSVVISGTTVQASGGLVEVVSATGITLADGGVVAAPGWTGTYGDTTDSTTASSAGGTVRLTATAGDITLGAGTLVSVAGDEGDAGRLELSAIAGSVTFGGTIDGTAGTDGTGGEFALETGGSVDLVALNTLVGGQGFTGGFEVRSRAGDLVLAAGQTLKSGSVVLTADGGFVTISGTIDTSGTNGGDIALWGNKGVTLTSTAKLDAHADGYADSEPYQASAGDITLGTDFVTRTTATSPDGVVSGTSGTITIAAGATLDLSVKNTTARVIALDSGLGYYYVAADTAGTLTLRAPVYTDASGKQTVDVNVASASSVVGAASVVLEGFRRWDLAVVAASGSYTGVTASNGDITLDVSAGLDTLAYDAATKTVSITDAGRGLNFLGDRDPTGTHETIVSFIQDLDLSAMYSKLGGLAALTDSSGASIFHVQPGVDLVSTGSITLSSNWNLAAGTVDIAGATAAGLMGSESYNGTTVDYIVPGSEAAVLADYTAMLYRTGASVTGEAPILTLRAGGDLVINGIVNDGFFSFQNSEDATYLAAASGTSVYSIGFGTYYKPSGAVTTSAGVGILMNFFGSNANKVTTTSAADPLDYVPYSVEANSAAPGRSSDLFGTMELFPTLATSDGRQMTSASYRLVAGAAVDRTSAGQITASANPTAINPLSLGSAIVDGSYTYTTASGTTVTVYYGFAPSLTGNNCSAISAYCASSVEEWLNLVSANTSGRTFTGTAVYWGTQAEHYGTTAGRVTFATAPTTSSSGYIIDSMSDLVYMKLYLDSSSTGVTLSGSLSTLSLRDYVKSGADPYLAALYYSDSTTVTTAGQVVTYTLNGQSYSYTMTGDDFFTVVGTSGGTSSNPYMTTNNNNIALLVSVKTAAYILENYVTPLFPTSTASTTHSVSGMIRTGTGDIAIAAARSVDLTAGLSASSTADAVAVYTAGQRATTTTATATDVATGQTVTVDLTANQVSGGLYLVNGGDITIAAGEDVIGVTTSIVSSYAASNNASLDWMANTSTSGATISQADQHLLLGEFDTGVGALAGGDITVTAGRDIDDVAAFATPAIRTVGLTFADGSTGKGIQFLGDSDVVLRAGRDIAGGLVYVTSGSATLSAERDIVSAGRLISSPTSTARTTRLRLTNAVATVSAGRDLTVTWAGALPFGLNNEAFWVSSASSLTVTAGGDVGLDLFVNSSVGSYDGVVVPGTITLSALTGDLTFLRNGSSIGVQPYLFMVPDTDGQLVITAGGGIGAATIVMDDADPAYLPGPFRNTGTSASRGLTFPTVTSSTTEAQLRLYHNQDITHLDDAEPVFVAAGGDITGLVLSVPKQARVVAGGDIVNMMFFGQNLSATDITRIAAAGDITATTKLLKNAAGTALATLGGNTFVIGGPGALFLEAGGDIGPFLNSATITTGVWSENCACTIYTTSDYAGGVLSVGYDWNPWLKSIVTEAGGGADLYVMFGLGAIGPDYAALREKYVNPANVSFLTWEGYADELVAWMQARHPDLLLSAYGTTAVTEAQAYAAFTSLPMLEQRIFLLSEVYYNELEQVAVTTSASYQKYSRGYEAVNTLFPAANGYTANSLEGGAVDTALVATGDLDLRLATLQTTRGGDINLIGPGGDIIAGSVVRTSTQAARRNYYAPVYSGLTNSTVWESVVSGSTSGGTAIDSIPTGLEGILTLRGGSVRSFTDGSLVLNQSRLFTQGGGDIVAWSSNGDLNAGQGPKTSANFPPIVVSFDWNLFGEVDKQAGVTGAGIAAFQPSVDEEAPDVYLLAPRGTVDAGDAGLRVAGNLSVVALEVRNADNIQVGGAVTGLQVEAPATIPLTVETKDKAAADAVAAASQQATASERASVIIVEILGYGGGEGGSTPADEERRRRPPERQSYDPNGMLRVLGHGRFTDEQLMALTDEERKALSRFVAR